MIQGVLLDLKFFLTFFVITVIEFGLLFTTLVENSDTYTNIGTLGYYIMAIRTSLGDFDVDNYGDVQDHFMLATLRWVIWLIAVLVLNIIFMNFIIAVISESYAKTM